MQQRSPPEKLGTVGLLLCRLADRCSVFVLQPHDFKCLFFVYFDVYIKYVVFVGTIYNYFIKHFS